MRKPLGWLFAAVLVATVSCSSVPSSGGVKVVGIAPSAGAPNNVADSEIRLSGKHYDPKAGPADVVSGFLDAEVDTTNEGKQLATEYLTDRSIWDRDAETLVYRTKEVEVLPVVAPDPKRDVRVTFQMLARIDKNGEYHVDSGSTSQNFELGGSDAGGWRLSRLPAGRRIDNSYLDQVFKRVVPLFYTADPESDVLIPDPFYVLRETLPVVSALVQRLLDGPTPSLRAALMPGGSASPTWGFPAGTKLLTAPVDANIVELTFSEELDAVPRANRGRLVAQLVWTLTSQDLRIDGVRIKVGDHPFVFSDVQNPAEQSQAQWARYDPDAAVAGRASHFNRDGTLAAYRPSSTVRLGRALGDATAQPAVDASGTQVAIVAPVAKKPSLRELRVGPADAGKLDVQLTAGRLTKPSWGTALDGVWVVAQQGEDLPKVLTVRGAANDSQKLIRAPDLYGPVDAFEVAPDGTRVAAIVDRAGERRVEIGYITRGVFAGTASQVGGFRAVTTDLNVVAVAWADSGKLAIIASRGTQAPDVFTVLVDGSAVRQWTGSSEKIARGSAAQLVALPVQHDDAKRGDIQSGALLLAVSRRDGSKVATEVYINLGLEWVPLPTEGAPRSSPSTDEPTHPAQSR